MNLLVSSERHHEDEDEDVKKWEDLSRNIKKTIFNNKSKTSIK